MAAVPEAKSQGSRGSRAPKAKVTNEAVAACQGEPRRSGSMPSSSRAWVSRASSGSPIISADQLAGHPRVHAPLLVDGDQLVPLRCGAPAQGLALDVELALE